MSRIDNGSVSSPAQPRTQSGRDLPPKADAKRPAPVGDGLEARSPASPFETPRARTLPPTRSAPSAAAVEGDHRTGGSDPRPATHVVRQGETLYSLSQRYGVSVSQLRAANGLAGDRIEIDQRLKIPGHVEITVASQQTLYSLATKHGTDVASLMRKNAFHSDVLSVGQRLVVPGEMPQKAVPEKEGKHYVRAGETLYSLSRKYGTTPEAFRRVNPEISGNLIVAGTYIQIPGRPYVIREGPAKPEVQKPTGMTPAEQKAALDQLQRLIDQGPDDVFNRTLQKLVDENPKAAVHLMEKVTPYWSSGDRDAVTALRQDFAETREVIDGDIAAAVSDYQSRFEGTDPRAGFLLFMFSRLLPTRIPLKGDMIRTILKAPVWQVEEDLQEMAAMLGEPPPAFRQVHEDSQAMLADVLWNAVDQLSVGEDEKRAIVQAYAMALAEASVEHLHEVVPELGPTLDDVTGENIRHLAVKALANMLLGSRLPGGKIP